MIVYVESNFILELALLQEDCQSCAAMVEMADSRAITLVMPTFCVGEPYDTLARRSKKRQSLNDELTRELHQLSRSQPYRQAEEQWQSLTHLLGKSSDEEIRRLNEAIERIVHTAELIPVELDVVQAAGLLQRTRDFSPQDAMIYASVVGHLKSCAGGPKCFITKDRADFLDPDTVTELGDYQCKLLTTFSDGLGYVRSCL